jgi:alpha-galactosidase
MRFHYLTPLLLPLAISQAEDKNIAIETAHSAVVVRINGEQLAGIVHLGQKLANAADYAQLPANRKTGEDYTGLYNSAYTPAGSRNLLEPAVQVIHADGNTSLDLKFTGSETKQESGDSTLTAIHMKDPKYAFEVTLNYRAFAYEDVIEQWTTIRHAESGPVKLQKYASANLYLPAKSYYLTHFHGDWAQEMKPEEEQLTAGIKVLDSKLGTRADMFQPPSFMVSVDKPATEDEGQVIAANLGWTGNYQISFEVDPLRNLRLIAGINPFESEYLLAPDKDFVTPSFIYTWTDHGKGQASRNLHTWARKHCIPQGEGKRLTLLNNWESTYFDFDEPKLKELFKDAKKLGTDIFLLDDGWFANKYARNDDHTGLGDWDENKKKLPNGISGLVKEADAAGVGFGIWLEPEMISPKSELFEKHPDWAILQPDRQPYYFRNQLVLDLTKPEVEEYVFGVVDKVLSENPKLAYVKWDCNSVIYNAHSSTSQSNLYVDYVKAFYRVADRLRNKYPQIPLMLCAGGGGRVDYGALRYFTEFWPSDNTEPLERVFMQWDYSYFFPSIATCCHVTDWGKQPLKFRTDVAMMGKMGYDIVVSKMDEKELAFSQEVLKSYSRLNDVIWHGDLYRLVSPYEGDFASLAYVNEAKDKAVWFNYLVNRRYKRGSESPVVLKGLDPKKKYSIREINLFPGTKSSINDAASATYSGDYLMTIGFNPQVTPDRASVVLEVTAEK